MTTRVVALRANDEFEVRSAAREEVIKFNLAGGGENAVGSDIASVQSRWSVLPPPVALDLLDLCVSVYTTDKMIERATTGWDGWTRDVTLYVSVRDLDVWNGTAGGVLTDLVNYLTGDTWTLVFRPFSSTDSLPTGSATVTAEEVSLFSGGLDSYVGAIDALEQKKNILLVSHHGRGPAGAASISQTRTINILKDTFSGIERLSYYIASPQKHSPEDSSRSRALLFYGLAAATALGTGAGQMVIPENGHVSLNVPLTTSHLGSASTRSTHPYTIHLWQRLLHALGMKLNVVLPYHHMTKGEVLTQCSKPDLMRKGLTATVSCGNPNVAARDAKLPPELRKPGTHCGYCWACLVRRAAIQAALGDDPTLYAYSDPRELTGDKARTVKAARLAFRTEGEHPTMARVLSAGPLPLPAGEVEQFLGVYRRGQQEVRQFLKGYGL
ncbi:Qat anti-phage system QueC-like protein QatC [Deinococcus petrolearius]|uniref:Qat anti-phage system QueC-like protein QatC n=1 Tax=Deinococcus petrolearius TaxID=1751295 RepID=A0ABW1DMA1_9DEIO